MRVEPGIKVPNCHSADGFKNSPWFAKVGGRQGGTLPGCKEGQGNQPVVQFAGGHRYRGGCKFQGDHKEGKNNGGEKGLSSA